MPKPLNYTTTIDPIKTLAEIEQILVGHGARRVAKDFDDDGSPTAVTFELRTGGQVDQYRLPARADRVLLRLQDLHRAGELRKGFVSPSQAERIAWRVLKDWLAAQLELVDLGMRPVDEVLLPYQLHGGQTFYEAYLERRSLPAPK